MSSTATWEHEEVESAAQSDERSEPLSSTSSVTALKDLVLQLLC